MDIGAQYDKIYRYCFYRVRDIQTAEDITQETFLKFFQSGYREQGKALNYLYRIAGNLCIDEYRRRERENYQEGMDVEGLNGNSFEEELVDSITVKEALKELTKEERELLFMRYVNEEPPAVIAELYGMSRFALYRKLKKIEGKLSRRLAAEWRLI